MATSLKSTKLKIGPQTGHTRGAVRGEGFPKAHDATHKFIREFPAILLSKRGQVRRRRFQRRRRRAFALRAFSMTRRAVLLICLPSRYPFNRFGARLFRYRLILRGCNAS